MKTAFNKLVLVAVIAVFGSLSALAAGPAVAAANPSAAQRPKFTYATIQAIETFSQRRLTERDFAAVKNVAQTLVLLDEQDPSRTAVMILSESYGKYKRIYDRAFKAIETPQNKIIIEELRELMGHFYEDGNG